MVPEIAEQIREITARPLDWEFVLSEATENSVGPLLEMNLRAMAPESVPAAVMERLKITCRANTVRCLFLAAELHKILELFRAAGIVAIPYKGPVLAEQVYGNLTLRDFDDLDIILPQRDLVKAHEVMLGLGYQARFPWILSKDSRTALVPGEYNYRDEKRRAVVELHTELTLRHFPVVPDIDRFAQRLVKVMVAGREVLTFAPEDLLSALCVHGSKDFWERISWIADVAELIQRHADLDWDAAFRTAESLRVERMVHLGLALADDLLQAPMPAEIRKRVREDGEAVSVAREVEAANFEPRAFLEQAQEAGCGFAGGWCEGRWQGGDIPCVLRWFPRRRTGRWCNCLVRSRRFILRFDHCGCCTSMDGHGDARMRRCELGCRRTHFR